MERNTEARSCGGHGSRSRCPELLRGDSMSVSVSSTTGSRFELCVPPEETVDGLKRRLSEKLRVPGERLMLLHRDTTLNSGKLLDCGVVDGTRLTLVPTVESGLLSQSRRPERSVLQALESLTDTQVSEFLSGRSPLTLALRVGDHMMFVQLQLAAHQSGSPAGRTHHSDGPRSPCGSTGSESPHERTRPSPHANHAHRCQSPAHPAGSTQTQRCKPGAVIESLVNHAPGVFSGTFSGTLHPNCQDSSGRPRRDISTVLQILSDLLSATRHYQGHTPTLTHLSCKTPSTPPSSPPSTPPLTPPSPTSERLGLLRRPSGERVRQSENRATRCKVQQLQLLLQQRRLRRRARREPRGPYPWSPGQRTGPTHSSAAALELDFQEPVRSTEFVAA